MATKVAINGFGRIGRLVARAILERGDDDFELVAINDLADAKSNALLFQYDSTHGRFPGTVTAEGGAIVVNGKRIAVTQEREPRNLPHGDMGIDIVLECTGFFQSKEASAPHIEAGAKRVLISAPAKGDLKTVVYGVNHEILTGDDTIVSNASCTTNCRAPVAKVLHETVGIERGFMTTIHSYTNDQRMLDQIHKDLRRARGGAGRAARGVPGLPLNPSVRAGCPKVHRALSPLSRAGHRLCGHVRPAPPDAATAPHPAQSAARCCSESESRRAA